MKKLRNELKFSVNTAYLELLKGRLQTILLPDSHETDENGYFIRSVYFDNIDYSAYYDKIAGVDLRTKYRIRTYNFSDSFIVLEKKEKIGEMTSKSSAVIDRNVFERLCRGKVDDFVYSENGLIREFAAKIKAENFAPSVVVDYRRKCFVSPISETRITIDSAVSAGEFEMPLFFSKKLLTVPTSFDNTEILEVKYDSFLLPTVAELISDIPKIRCSNSKYCKCAETLYWGVK